VLRTIQKLYHNLFLFPKQPHYLPQSHHINCNFVNALIGRTGSTNSLELSVSLQTTDMGEVLTTTALLDLGATSQFIHSNFMEQHHLTTKLLSQPIPIFNMDGSPNEAGSISKVVKVVLWYHDHSEKATFMVTGLGKQDIILGLMWLCEHNPEVDWKSGEVKMSHCPNHCCTCQNKANVKQKAWLMEEANIRACCTGPMPEPDVEMEDIPDLVNIDEEEDDEEPEGQFIPIAASTNLW
jgi:Retroviral aspartyl protease